MLIGSYDFKQRGLLACLPKDSRQLSCSVQVFDPDSGQAKLYRMAIKPIVEEVLEGFNCTIFAYGQTGTGKTYTMEVSHEPFHRQKPCPCCPKAVSACVKCTS